MMNSIINTEFRTFSLANKYPFSDESLMQDRSGRDIPYSIFIDINVHTITQTKSVYISRIFLPSRNENDSLDWAVKNLCIEFSGDTGVLGYAYNVQGGSAVIIAGPCSDKRINQTADTETTKCAKQRCVKKDDVVIGTIVTSDNITYLASMASVHELTFESNGLEVHPSRVYSIPLFSQSLFINGISIPTNSPITFNFLSKRFILTPETDEDEGYLSFNYTVDGNTLNNTVIKTINGKAFKNNHALLLSNSDNNNIRITIKNQGLYILKVGDDE